MRTAAKSDWSAVIQAGLPQLDADTAERTLITAHWRQGRDEGNLGPGRLVRRTSNGRDDLVPFLVIRLLAVATMLALTACSPDGQVTYPAGGDCTSRYEDLAHAATREDLDSRLTSKVDPTIVGLRIQGKAPASGQDHQPAEIVDLLNARKRRVMQIEVFQLADGQWYAGRWMQCID